MKTCYHCARALSLQDRVGRRDTCPECGVDLRCCRNCLFYDPRAAQACQEPNTDHQIDKEIGNFCEYFAFAEERRLQSSATASSARAQLEALFKKR